MEIKIKVLTSIQNEWVGYFGDCVKLRLNNSTNVLEHVKTFISNDFGIPTSFIKIEKLNKPNMFRLTIPDEGYEILMSNLP